MKILFIILSFVLVQNSFAQTDTSAIKFYSGSGSGVYSLLKIKQDSTYHIHFGDKWLSVNPYTDTCINTASYFHTLIEEFRNQALYALVCNILQYITIDGKITNKKAFSTAVKFYLDYLKQNHLP